MTAALRHLLFAVLALGLFAAPGAAAGLRVEAAEVTEATEEVVAPPSARPASPDRAAPSAPRSAATPALLPHRPHRAVDRYAPIPLHVLLCVWRE